MLSDPPKIPGNPDPNPQIPCAVTQPIEQPVEETEEEGLDGAE
jgi:hypothetical protein